MDRIDLFGVFVRVVECASFTKAADTLGLPRSTVSTAVQQLERRLGGRLLHRTTRSVVPTPDGLAIYERCTRLLADCEEMEALLRPSAAGPHGKLRINVPSRIGRLILAPALPDFFALYPEVEIVLGITDRPVDLIPEGVDCVIRVGTPAESELVARRIGELELINCASPAYLAAFGSPQDAADLGQHKAVQFLDPSSGRPVPWEWMEAGRLETRDVAGPVSVNDAEAYIACCLAGLGLIQIPAYDVAAHLAAGELVEVMPHQRAPSMPMAFLYPHRRHVSHRLAVFMDWAQDLMRGHVGSARPSARPGGRIAVDGAGVQSGLETSASPGLAPAASTHAKRKVPRRG